MKFIYSVGILIVLASSIHSIELDSLKPEGRTKFDDDLREFVEFLRLQMQCGYEPAGIPPLAPYQADFKKFNIQGDSYSFVGNLSNLVINGLDEFEVRDLSWNNVFQKLSFDFNFPSIKAQSTYQLNALTNMFGAAVKIFGNGNFNLELIELHVRGSFKLRPSLSGGLAVWSFKAELDLGNVQSKTTGIMNSIIYTKFFNAWIEEFIILTFGESEVVSDAVSNLVVPPLNNALKNISMIELVALIMGLAKDVVPTEAIC